MRPAQKKHADRFRHFGQRLYQRYGITLTEALLQELLAQIQADDGVTVMWGDSRNDTLTYTVDSSAGPLAVVYDFVQQELVTALPKGAVRK